RPEGTPVPVEAAAPAHTPEPEPAQLSHSENRSARRQGTSHTAATLDWEKSIQQYMQNKPAKA
ncbi:MAG: hypothetical protein WB439_17675, partial [Acidobacteriaceae bacterium]